MIIFNTAPFMSLLLGALINKEKLTCVQVILMICSFVGVVFIAMSKSLDKKG
jgi:drug/metabolite transporter (DMT)-like permease